MSYRQDNLRRLKKIKTFFALLILAAVFYLFPNFILTKSYGILSFAVMPVWRLESRINENIRGAAAFFRLKASLEQDNQRLTDELYAADLELGSLGSLEQENEQLLAEMGRQIPKKATSTIAAVLAGPNIPPYEYLIIDAGRNYGVAVGDRVIYEPNVVLGEVSQVFADSARVRLYSASGVQTDVLVPSTKIWHAVALGYGGGNFSIELPSGIAVDKGAEILIPDSGIYVLGAVDYVQDDRTTATERLFIRYPVNIKNIRFIHVVKMPNGLQK